MRKIRDFSKMQRVGVFIGAVLAVLALVAHNPFNGYWTEKPEQYDTPCGPNNDPCVAVNWYPLDFTDWTSKEPLVPWFGNLVHFLTAEAGIIILIILWVAINSE